MLGHWPARGTRLLEINCGKGYFSTFLDNLGFQVAPTAGHARAGQFDASPPTWRPLAVRAGNLPFETDGFDWAILHLGLEKPGDIAQALDECSRISSLGFAVTFWNRLSLALLLKARWQEPVRECSRPHPFWRPWGCMGKYPGRKRLGSILTLPRKCWNEKNPLAGLNRLGQSLPFGAWCVISVEYGDRYPLTGLPLRLETDQP